MPAFSIDEKTLGDFFSRARPLWGTKATVRKQQMKQFMDAMKLATAYYAEKELPKSAKKLEEDMLKMGIRSNLVPALKNLVAVFFLSDPKIDELKNAIREIVVQASGGQSAKVRIPDLWRNLNLGRSETIVAIYKLILEDKRFSRVFLGGDTFLVFRPEVS
ncbi:MAG: hypothetical protein NZ992_00100 [Candidatus Korarchaeum sp.]|nr:hypothetical protein [Candidatus Korarchaeum sp.]MDW8093368.1 hypothetical protein [Nitrososphaerota archaeon]